MQLIQARLAGRPLPELAPLDQPEPPAEADAAHAGAERIEPDVQQAARLLDAALPGTDANPLPGGLVQPQPLWLAECGNFTSRALPFPGLRARMHLRALALMGCVAAVPGSAELQLTEAQALEFLRDSPVPIVSCNLKLKLDGAEVLPYLKLAPGWYLTGVSSWQPAVGEPPAQRWWELNDALHSVQGVLGQLPRDARLIVIAAYQPETAYRSLAQLPLALLVGGSVPLPAAPAPMLPAPPGKAEVLRLATLDASAGAVQAAPWQIELSDIWPDDPQVIPLFKEEYKAIRERVLGVRANAGGKDAWKKVEWGQSDMYLPGASGSATGAEGAGGAPGGEQLAATAYVGAQACQSCHAEAYRAWQQSRHYHALESLLPQQDNENLDCLRCHSTALLQPGGYDPYAPNAVLGRVGCESCHGPGTEHAALMAGGKVPPAGDPVGAGHGQPASAAGAGMNPPAAAGPLRIRRGSLDDCVTCHDSYNSPRFNAQEYWAKVKH